MRYEWDENKRTKSVKEHGVDFYSVHEFDWDNAITRVDNRFAYDETRLVSLGFIKNRLHSLVYTERPPKTRIISLRRANKRETMYYEKEKNDPR